MLFLLPETHLSHLFLLPALDLLECFCLSLKLSWTTSLWEANPTSQSISWSSMLMDAVTFEWVSEWVSESCSVVSNSLWPHGLYSPWNSLGQNTQVVSLSLLQGIFPTQGSNPGLLHCRRILYSWATTKPMNTGVGSLSLPQGFFLTQESNCGLLHCRWISTTWAITFTLHFNFLFTAQLVSLGIKSCQARNMS